MSISVLANTFKLLGDPTRLRALLFLQREELTVTELVTLLSVSQSSVSGLLRQLMQAEVILTRRDGRFAFYRAVDSQPWLATALDGAGLSGADRQALEDVRRGRSTGEVDAPGLERHVPGRSWRALARSLLLLTDLGKVADLGVGPGDLTLLLARSATHLWAVDREPATLAVLETRAASLGVTNLTVVAQDLEELELPEAMDLCAVSLTLPLVERPQAVLEAAFRSLRPGGRIWLTELDAHEHASETQKLGHRWPGFSEDRLRTMLELAGFVDVTVGRGGRDKRPPRFSSLIAIGHREET